MVGMLDLQSRVHGFNSQSGRYEMASLLLEWVTGCLRTGKPSRYISNIKGNSAFHPSMIGKSSISLSE